MLAIRMQRTGRKGHAMFRVIVQDARRTPTSGKIVARLGSYDPHSKTITLDKEKASFYLEHGAQPSDRAALLLKKEGVKLPDWLKVSAKQEGSTRNPDKRRSTRPDEPATKEAPASEETEKAPAETTENVAEPAQTEAEAPEPEKTEEPTEESEKSEDKPEKPAEETPSESASEEKSEKSEEAESSGAEAKESDETDDKKA